jgi:hypothetical protein
MKTCEAMEVKLYALLTWALDGGGGQFHAPAVLSPGKEPSLTNNKNLE